LIVRAASLVPRSLRDGWATEIDYVPADSGSGHLSIRVYRLKASGGVGPYHRHTASDSAYFVLRGSVTVRLEDEVATLSPDDLVFVPSGVAHSVANESDEEVAFLEIYGPGTADFILAEDVSPDVGST
jgi:mannose-6-phosphate isomerase-like protein (cupin superfamily)